ncbi:MAG: 3'(2'),5'-bisphosphate nucleotidase [Gammaproteobacteria bacterium]|nr:MAG: 3'(2'),5'-bisphosphate nucleotidase [Gammaproteobacteria bacterium]
MSGLKQWIAPLLDLCDDAGVLIRRHYHNAQTTQVSYKIDQSPVTQADLDAHDVLVAGLATLTPKLPILSEESSATQYDKRHNWQRFWLLDPLDGTREFIARTGDFSVNIALIDAHKSVLGVLYLPLQNVAYVGVSGERAQLWDLGSDAEPRDLCARALADQLVICGSRQGACPQTQQRFMRWCKTQKPELDVLSSGGAMKFCQLADGVADCYPRYLPCCEWDVAAGQALLEAAGGCVVDMQGVPLRYNTRESLYSPHFLAIADPAAPLWRTFAREHGWSTFAALESRTG